MIYKFNTILKSAPWGGKRLPELKGVAATDEPIGESWELSAVKGNESVVAEGPEKGLTLSELVRRHGAELVGDKVFAEYGTEFPLLIKFIDAQQWLSLQVHPDQADAVALEGPEGRAKNEMWHIIDAAPGAKLIAGFKPGVTAAEYEAAEGSEKLLELVRKHDVEPGQDYYIPAGLIHAIGPGCLIAEVQQTSDITYRVYDYGRPRELHIPKARRALRFTERSLSEPLPYFSVDTLDVTSEGMTLEPVKGSFRAVMVLKGELTVNGQTAPAGTTLLVSASEGPLALAGPATLLLASLA